MGRFRNLPNTAVHKLVFLIALIACLLFPMTILPLDQDIVFLDGEGTALIKGDNFASARDKAIHDALQAVVFKAAGRFLAPKIVDDKLNPLKEKILIKAEEYIQNYRIINEKAEAEAYAVSIRAAVTLDGIKSDLLKIGLLQISQKKPQVTPVSLTVHGIKSYSDYVKLRELIQKSFNGISAVRQKSLEWGTLVMEVEIQGGAKALSAELDNMKQFPVQSRLTGNNAVEVMLLR